MLAHVGVSGAPAVSFPADAHLLGRMAACTADQLPLDYYVAYSACIRYLEPGGTQQPASSDHMQVGQTHAAVAKAPYRRLAG